MAAIGWQVVQLLGTYFVTHALEGTRESYGVFGLVLGLIAWIYLWRSLPWWRQRSTS